MPDYFYTKSEGNDKPDRPPVAIIPLNVQIGDNDGSAKWNYATGRDKNNNTGKYTYYDNTGGKRNSNLEFTDSFVLKSNRIDLMYFLLFLSPMREIPGETEFQKEARGVKPSQRFMFVVENKEKESMTRVSDTLKFARVEMAILEGLSSKDARKVAASMGIANAMEKGDFEVRDELLQAVRKMEKAGKKGYDKFLQVSNIDELTEVQFIIQRSIDLGLTKEDGPRSFTYINEAGKRMNEICGTYAGRTLRESVEYYLMNEPVEKERLRIAVEEKEMSIKVAEAQES